MLYRLGIRAADTLEQAAQVAGGDQRGFDVQQICRGEHTAVIRQVDHLADIACPADGQVGVGGEQRHRFTRLSLALAGELDIRGRGQGAGFVRRGGEGAVASQPLEDLRVFQCCQRFGVHQGEFTINGNNRREKHLTAGTKH